MKKCKQCGEQQPEENFRKYYNRTGRYSFCRTCESIMGRYKYLSKLVDRTEEQQSELDKINRLYMLRQQAGLAIPGSPTGVQDVSNIVNEQLSKLEGV